MKLEEQVISLEQARKLKELWCEQESYAVYQDYYGNWAYRLDTSDRRDHKTVPATFRMIPAYTASELMEILPHYIKNGKVLQVTKWRSCYIVTYGGEYDEAYITKDGNLACALWNTLIRLLENNLLPDTTTEWM